MNKKFVVGIIIVTLSLITASVILAGKMFQTAQVEASPEAKAIVEEDSHDWGEIPIKGGTVEKEFVIKNGGRESLKLYNVKTSCACTTAQFIGNERSPLFGMHTK